MQDYHPTLLPKLTIKENYQNLLDGISQSFPNRNICVSFDCSDSLFLVEPYNIFVYRLLKDGVRYTVLTERRESTERFCDFYSNKKGDNTRSQNTQLSAQAYSVTTNSAANAEKNPRIHLFMMLKIRKMQKFSCARVTASFPTLC